MECIAEIVFEISRTSRNIDVRATIGSWENVQSRLAVRLINTVWNQKFLQTLPHREYMDLSLVAYMDFVKNEDGIVSMAVTPNLLQMWRIDEEELFQTALSNLMNEKFIIRDMEEVIQEMRGEKIKPTPYDGQNFVFTDKFRKYGSRGLLRTDLLSQFAEEMGTDLFILPDSVHDLILTPVRSELTDADINDMMEVIRVFSEPEQDSLSNSVYYFSRASGEVSVYTLKTE